MAFEWWVCFTALICSTFARVSVVPPRQFVATLEGSATFSCIADPPADVVDVQWLVNETLLNLPNASSESVSSGLTQLRITNIPMDYNMTRIQCRVEFAASLVQISPNYTLLLVQGTLSDATLPTITVSNLTINLSWSPPFTLDITGVDIDITYCVLVVVSSMLLHSQCNIIQTEFIYPIPSRSECHEIIFSITPVNLVGHGVTTSVSYLSSQTRAKLVEIQYNKNLMAYLLIMSAPVCSSEATFIDLDTGEQIRFENEDHDTSVAMENITISALQLKTNRRYTVAVTAFNIAGSATSYTTISDCTHGIINSIILERQGSVKVMTNYTQYSASQGALLIFLTEAGKIAILLALDNNTSIDYTLPFNIQSGKYSVQVYDILDNGMIPTGTNYPAVATKFTKSNSRQGPVLIELWSSSLLENCYVTVSLLHIQTECSYNDFAVIGYQVLAQLSNSSALYANSTTNRQTMASIHIEKTGIYQVTILAVRHEDGILNSSVEYSTHLFVDINDADFNVTHVVTIPDEEENNTKTIGLATGIALIFVVSAIVIVSQSFVLINRCRKTSKKIQMSQTPEAMYQNSPQLYEEVLDVTAQSAQESPRAVASTVKHSYEEVTRTSSNLDDSCYQITACSAYGVKETD